MGLPDLGLTPYIRLMGPVASAQASALSDYFNARLRAALSPDVIFFDTAALLRSVVANPAGYGLTNVTDPCFDAAAPSPSVCSNPDQYVFWDELHPSARSHQILAEHLAQTVPEPSTFGLCSVVIACWLIKKKYQPARIRTRSSLVPPTKP
jgi:phospholipase/lecithinase/hemolysin